MCRCEHLAECQVINVLVRGRDHEGKGTDESLSSPKVRRLGSQLCVRGEGVQGVLTLICSGVAQTCHDVRVVELKEQLVVEEVDGERQEGKVKEEGRGRVKENAP